MTNLSEVPEPNDEKYYVCKREDIHNTVVGLPWSLFKRIEINDAVVIRRQDYFASPALATYAAMIATALKLIDDPKKRAQLSAIADYFQRMSELAGDEAWKFPDV